MAKSPSGWRGQSLRHSRAKKFGHAGGRYTTYKPISYEMSYNKTIIPSGTKAIPATNLPSDSQIKYWAENWKGMNEEEKSWARNYGFGLTKNEVTTESPKQFTKRTHGMTYQERTEEIDKLGTKEFNIEYADKDGDIFVSKVEGKDIKDATKNWRKKLKEHYKMSMPYLNKQITLMAVKEAKEE